jgi:hypothetical protein
MTVEQMIALLGQFDPQSRVVMEVGVHVFEPTVGLLDDDGFFKNRTTTANYGDVVIQRKEKQL